MLRSNLPRNNKVISSAGEESSETDTDSSGSTESLGSSEFSESSESSDSSEYSDSESDCIDTHKDECGIVQPRDEGTRAVTGGGLQQDSVGAEGVDKSRAKDSKEEEEEEDGNKKRRVKRKRRSEEEGSSSKEVKREEAGVHAKEKEEEKVDLLSEWRWDDFSSRSAKSEVLVDYYWQDFIPHPTTFDRQIRVKELPDTASVSKVRFLHTSGRRGFYNRVLASWGINSYATRTPQSYSVQHLRDVYKQTCLFLGDRPPETWRAQAGGAYIQTVRQKNLLGTCVEAEVTRMPIRVGAGEGYEAVWMGLMQGGVVVTRELLRGILMNLGVEQRKYDLESFYIYAQYYRRIRGTCHKAAADNCIHCHFIS